MYIENRGLKEWIIDDTFEEEFFNKCGIFNIDKKKVKWYSQQDEDKYIVQHILKHKINDGVFLEMGALDGESFSCTKTLEENFNFSGILIEPLHTYFNTLKIKRPKCELYNLAISNSDNEYVRYTGNNGEAGIVDFLHENKFKNEYKVKNIKLSNLLKNSQYKYIDIMIVDVEGAELEVIKSIDFNFPIYCIIFEAPSNQQEKNKAVSDYLKQKGFKYKDRQRGNEVWYNPTYFRRDLFNL